MWSVSPKRPLLISCGQHVKCVEGRSSFKGCDSHEVVGHSVVLLVTTVLVSLVQLEYLGRKNRELA